MESSHIFCIDGTLNVTQLLTFTSGLPLYLLPRKGLSPFLVHSLPCNSLALQPLNLVFCRKMCLVFRNFINFDNKHAKNEESVRSEESGKNEENEENEESVRNAGNEGRGSPLPRPCPSKNPRRPRQAQ